ncbi:Tetraspannin-like protein [Dinothrombium tinctorium]|uniref:Tetraspannin-like protein n=1 Tax=Dinothrombium tinctorium TaxID=1965070 RepID=A0A443QC14_9ACAR|nr:Tetraspannin-like protein [Dinothrombium tinctorium]
MIEYPTRAEDDPKRKAVDFLQWSMECCGIENGPEDWANIGIAQYAFELPMSCCYNPNEKNHYGRCTTTGSPQPFKKPCVQATKDNFRLYGGLISGIAIAIAVVQLIAACFACMLANAVIF